MSQTRTKYFFRPWIGSDYQSGFRGVRTLVVGVCHFCTYSCRYSHKCSDPAAVPDMDTLCPCYSECDDKEYSRLSNCNSIEVDAFVDRIASYPSYKYFTYYMLQCSGNLSKEKRTELWGHIAFTNFLQFFHRDKDALPDDPALFDAAYPALKEVVDELRPQVVYVWNDAAKECIRRNGDDFSYIGKADMQYGISLYVFCPRESALKGAALSKLRYTLGIKSDKHHMEWYLALVKKHIGACVGHDAEGRKALRRVAEGLKILVEDGILGATETSLYFRDTDSHKWTSCLKGVFLSYIKKSNPVLGRGVNPGIEAIFNERLATNKKDETKLNPNERGVLNSISSAFQFRKN